MFGTSGRYVRGGLGWVLGTTGLCTIDKTAVRVLSDSIFYILHSLWLNILNFILEDSLNIIFEELIGKMRRILKLERIRTEWETIHVFNICVSYVARKACFQKL